MWGKTYKSTCFIPVYSLWHISSHVIIAVHHASKLSIFRVLKWEKGQLMRKDILNVSWLGTFRVWMNMVGSGRPFNAISTRSLVKSCKNVGNNYRNSRALMADSLPWNSFLTVLNTDRLSCIISSSSRCWRIVTTGVGHHNVTRFNINYRVGGWKEAENLRINCCLRVPYDFLLHKCGHRGWNSSDFGHRVLI